MYVCLCVFLIIKILTYLNATELRYIKSSTPRHVLPYMPHGRHPSGLYAVPDGFQKVVSKRSPTGVTLERTREREREIKKK
jgi:hypothetical protein